MAYNQSQFSQPMDFYGNPVAPPVRVVPVSKGNPVLLPRINSKPVRK